MADIPEGWVLCDGTQGTPNLIAQFVRGAVAGQDSGATGGEDTHVLLTAELTNHDHSFSESTHSHTSKTSIATGANPDSFRRLTNTVNIASFTIGSNTSGITIDNTGTDTTHENKPPFFELAYIMKT